MFSALSAQSTRCDATSGCEGHVLCPVGWHLAPTFPLPSGVQKVDVTKETPDQTADRLIGFLKIIKYKPSVQDP